jgi:hypothetical protein
MEAVSRMIHHIISVRQRHPFTKILGGKSDKKPHTDEYHCMGPVYFKFPSWKKDTKASIPG